MKPIIPRPTKDGGMVIAVVPRGTEFKAWAGGYIAVHPDHQPLIINPDGTTEILKPCKCKEGIGAAEMRDEKIAELAEAIISDQWATDPARHAIYNLLVMAMGLAWDAALAEL